jgi:DNA mismatch repair protein MutS2
MDSRTFSLLGFDRIRDLIADRTQTAFGNELAHQIAPMDNIAGIEHEFDLLQECLGLSEEVSLSNVLDLRPYLTSISSDTVLPPLVLRDTAKTLEALRKTKEFFFKRKDTSPQIYQLIKAIEINDSLEKAINKAIDEFGEIKTDASTKLKKIRSEITKKRNEIIKKLEVIVSEDSEFLQDNNFTIRHDRFCIPLKIEDQKKIPGIMHEYSPARKTVFIEPMILVDSQNELARYRDEERNEIQRILSALTNELFNIRDELLTTFLTIGILDILQAKKRFALKFNCTRPLLSKDGIIRIIKGVHPLLTLSKSDVVPFDLVFPESTNIILISGPNAGGKTVVIKTVGLFVLMFVSGIYLPAGKGTEIPFFEKVFADIGDEQSLDSNLSSFSAHILRIKEIIENANNKTLVLLDEIGSSTAPEEGSALAIAVLEYLRDSGAYCLATSHFNPLKASVNDAPGMVNAAMEFTDHPTYHFTIGLPGTSSALEISKELGFPQKLLNRAKNFLNQDWLKLTERLEVLASETEKTIVLNDKLKKEKSELEQIRMVYDVKLKKFKSFEQEERKKILNETRRLLLEQRRNIENLIRNIKESNAEKKSIVAAKQYIEAQLTEVGTKIEQKALSEKPNEHKELLKAGDLVFSNTFQKAGVVLEASENNVSVAFGSIRFELKHDDLEKVAKDKESALDLHEIDQPNRIDYQPIEFNPILNILGQTKHDAIISLSRFVNDAMDNRIFEVSIIHGKGKGVLKNVVWDLLRNDSRVQELHFGEAFEGGWGLTKVVLKKNNND